MQELIDKIRNEALFPLIIKIGKKTEKKHFTDIPIIIGASPRSGTTLLLSILDAYPNIHAIQKQTYAFTKWRRNSDPGSDEYEPFRLDKIYQELILHKISPKAKRLCEKTPKNILFFDKILNYFGENAQLIHMIRDGRDVVTSKHPLHKPNEYWVSVEKWVNDVKTGLKFKNYPNVFTIKYEDVIYNFYEELKKLSNFLNENFILTEKSWKQRTTVRKSKHWAKPIQDIHAKSIQRWKKHEHEKRIQEFRQNSEAVELLESLGYEI